MERDELKRLEDSLWEAADRLRANSKLNATEYSMPVLGLIFLRHATNRFDRVREQIEARLPRRGGKTRPITAADFASEGSIFLPEEARYDTIAGLPEDQDIGKAIKEAMEAVEAQVPELLQGVLPREYPKFDPDLLRNLVRVFNSDELRTPTNDDIFGRIYEYFLNKFAMSGAQEGGEFFTPPSLVRTIVNFIEPTHGLILDPAVGSAGMFVQAAHAAEAAGRKPSDVLSFFGQEKSETNTRLALMNLAVHGLEGTIQQGNSFYDRIDDKVGQCDFVMANPPFNVDMVDPTKLKDDPRLLASVKTLGISKKTNTVSNANYLWIQYFYGYLKPQGRAGFVMAQSATDAGHWEKKIRQQLVETGDVDIMVSIGTNFFYTRSLPCSLWFFDKGRAAERKNQTLMLDARNIYRVISRKIRDFSDEQLANLTAIVWLYRGQTDRYLELIRDYFATSQDAAAQLGESLAALDAPNDKLSAQLDNLLKSAPKDAEAEALTALQATITERGDAISSLSKTRTALLADLSKWFEQQGMKIPATNAEQVARHDSFQPFIERFATLRRQINEVHKLSNRAFDSAKRDLGATKWDAWEGREISKQQDALDEARHAALEAIKASTYPFAQVTWLQTRFPDGEYADVLGLCKMVSNEEIAEQDYSLTPGRYVGVAPPEPEDEEAVEERLREIHVELASLNEEAVALAATISMNFEELVG
ncbi:type I restriction-modification system subunit M [Bradymonas sediminis]|uniref:site-specific DNA-methyltransferase (adenine-specific) n=1 Tax=Bradymonas sediminis TaxID=1548548 RepID=A0A2Z4FI61_9DELT|nr:class I SAM-dependent DNA methyltransferase [Bradymonas sediminis]AWV88697.1 SAM-dependent DNA methyltransferase [Bradymonas sediminis]TDP63615.1 type I restriction enzyme M protein [Bradymonas sediminis]